MHTREQTASGAEAVAARDTGGSLWDFAVQSYERDGVAEICLRLQDDHGVDVNLLLFALWAAAGARALSAADIAAADRRCLPWREGVIEVLRRQRRRWKAAAEFAEEYAAVKALELDAERRQLTLLEQFFAELPAPDSPVPANPVNWRELAGANLAAVLRHFEADPAPALLAPLLQAAAQR